MVHGSVFGVYDRQWTLHGGRQWGTSDWEMASASHALGNGRFAATLMTSAEPLTLPTRGYPLLLETGGASGGLRLANVQHPHDAIGEASLSYEYSVNNNLIFSLYGGPVGEPALGPQFYMHRASAAADPFAPIGHHWEDASHSSDGVVKLGIGSHALKLEGSAFNARERQEGADVSRFRGARLDSYSGRLTATPISGFSVVGWGGYLADHDPLEPGLGMQRYGASASTSSSRLNTTFVWGRNVHHHGTRAHDHDPNATPRLNHATNALLAEATFNAGPRTELFGRVEQAEKMGDDLGFLGGDFTQLFTVRSLALGVTRDVREAYGLSLSVGARGALNVIPKTLESMYRTTTPSGFAVFLRLRPALSKHAGMHDMPM
jgi:hypothetical protein